MADAPRTVVENIDHVLGLENELTARRGLAGRVVDRVVNGAGRLRFVVVQLLAVALWVVVNAGLVPGVPAFDPFPYSLAGEVLSLEGVLLACFVLMKQRHESRLSERRSHLTLQANLLVEREVSKLIQMMQHLAAASGNHALVADAEATEMAERTSVHHLADQLDRRLDEVPD